MTMRYGRFGLNATLLTRLLMPLKSPRSEPLSQMNACGARARHSGSDHRGCGGEI